MIVNIVVAASENNVIGKDNTLLWHLPNDMAFFRNTTWGMPVIMGRRTYESVGKPLKGRTNIIISRTANANAFAEYAEQDRPVVVRSIQEALDVAADTDARECYVIGGGEIYSIALPFTNRIYMTRVRAAFEGDTFFPAISEAEWRLVSALPFEADEKHAFAYRIETWERK